MQDRFKFRAWDGIAKEYIFDSYALYELFVNDIDDSYQVEQCTGLKDKNGKLIYEGDIVETHDYTTEHSQIVFDKGCYVLKSKDAAMYEHLSNYEKECEVIGNIHENPELLEDNK